MTAEIVTTCHGAIWGKTCKNIFTGLNAFCIEIKMEWLNKERNLKKTYSLSMNKLT